MKKISVFLIAAAMLFAFTSSVSASEFSFYGNLRLSTFSWEDSKELNVGGLSGAEIDENTNDSTTGPDQMFFNESDRDLDLSLTGISRFGAKITVSDELAANIEFGVGSSVALRHLYGEYDFGAGKILVGQTWHPLIGVGYSNQVANVDDGLGFASFSCGRRPQVRLTFGDFTLHFMQPDTNVISGIGDGIDVVADPFGGVYNVVTANQFYDEDATWPHIAAGYNTAYENFSFSIVGGFQTYEVSDTRGETYSVLSAYNGATTSYVEKRGRSYDVDSHVLKFGVQGDFGVFKLGATYGFGQNVGNMGLNAASGNSGSTRGAYYRAERDANGDFKYNDKDYMTHGIDDIGDIDTIAYTIVGSFKVNDLVTLEAGYGKVSNDADDAQQDDEASAYYLQAAISVADGFTVTPEIGKYDYEDNCQGVDEGDSTYFGAKWQINF